MLKLLKLMLKKQVFYHTRPAASVCTKMLLDKSVSDLEDVSADRSSFLMLYSPHHSWLAYMTVLSTFFEGRAGAGGMHLFLLR